MFSSLLAAAAPDGDRFASFDVPGWVWVAFVAFVVTLLVGDLLLVHRGAHVITFRGCGDRVGGVDHHRHVVLPGHALVAGRDRRR